MTNDQVRFVANKMMLAVEWLDLHVTTRRPADRSALAYKLDDLRKGLLKLMAAPMRTPSLRSLAPYQTDASQGEGEDSPHSQSQP